MLNVSVREGQVSSFNYSYNGFSPVVTVRFVPGTASTSDGYGGTLIGTATTSINGYVYGSHTYSFGAASDMTDEANEQFAIEIYLNGILDETVFVTVLDDLAWHGTEAIDQWEGGTGADTYFGYAGADEVIGRDGNDFIDGGADGDWLSGGIGNDSLLGGLGDDSLEGQNGVDRLIGGQGSDTLLGGYGADDLAGGEGHDKLAGGSDSDSLAGGSGHDSIEGDNGHDHLDGGLGLDWLSGGTGLDRLDGGSGNDVLTGGASSDVFLFGGRFGNDRITDFEILGPERIDLSGIGEIRNFRDLVANYAMDTEAGVLIEMGRRGSILLEGIDLSELSNREFIF